MPTPIDLFTVIPRSQEISSIQHTELHKPNDQQMQLNSQFNQQVKHDQKKTVKSMKGENNEFRYDAKEKGNGHTSGKDKQDLKKKDQKESKDDKQIKRSSFDIKI